MNTVDAIRSRRAIKHFDASHNMTEDEVNELLALAMLSPTAFNIQNWRYVVVSDKELRTQIKEVSWGQEQVTDTSLFIVLCADLKAAFKRFILKIHGLNCLVFVSVKTAF